MRQEPDYVLTQPRGKRECTPAEADKEDEATQEQRRKLIPAIRVEVTGCFMRSARYLQRKGLVRASPASESFV